MTKPSSPSSVRVGRRHRIAALFALASVSFGFAAILGVAAEPVAAASVDSIGRLTKTESIGRTHLIRGNDITVDTRDVSVTVSQTLNLRDRQAITVTWKGAHPTGGVVPDSNSAFAAQQEYPVVILQCRGSDSATAKVKVTPETCWTAEASERAQGDQSFLWPPYRMDRFASPSDRNQLVGVPTPIPPACKNVAGSQHWIPFLSSNGTSYGGGLLDPETGNPCAGSAPEAGAGSQTAPSNTTYGSTFPDGTGRVNFVINTVESNASLGCTKGVACSLVVIPIMGISCDADGAALPAGDSQNRPPTADERTAAQAQCQKVGHYLPGALSDGGINNEDLAVSGLLWWSSSNWNNRLSFPISFTQSSNVCDLVSSGTPAYVYGSQALVPATQQWGPYFCLNPKLFKFQHVQFSEPGSRNLLATGSIKAAFSAGPPQEPFDKPIVQAPIAVSGFAIAYRLDGVDGKEVRTLNMTPRLLAKLMTNSYPGSVGVQRDHPGLATNPLDIVADPEFRALNPGMMTRDNAYDSLSSSVLYSVSSDSDLMWALTSYINADPASRKWLDGTPDPWGMVVNPSYKGIALPTISWPQQDTWSNDLIKNVVPCFADVKLPWFPLMNAPLANPAFVSLNMQYGISPSQVVCKDAGQPNQKLVGLGKIPPGRRAVFGIVSLGDAERYQIPAANLLSYVSPAATDKFTSAAGRTFVGPTDSGLKAAVNLAKPDKTLGTWPIPYASLRTAAGRSAYPGTLLMSIDVPTTGLSAVQAKRYAELIRFMTTDGQTPGFGAGQLPPGFLPLSAGGGLSKLVAYSGKAADAVEQQKGFVPSVDGIDPTPSPTPTTSSPTPIATPTYGGGSPSSTDSGTEIPTTGPTSSPSSAPSSAAPSPSPSPSVSQIVAEPVGKTKALSPSFGANIVPALILMAVASGVLCVTIALRRP